MAEGGPCRFALYALITREVTDIAGRGGQEAIRSDLKPLEELQRAWPTLSLGPPASIRLRLVEVQFRAGMTAVRIEDALFDRAPGDEPPRDAQARIVRVTLPIPNAKV